MCGKMLLMDQSIYHLKTAEKKILCMLLYFKIFFCKETEAKVMFSIHCLFLHIGAALKQPWF